MNGTISGRTLCSFLFRFVHDVRIDSASFAKLDALEQEKIRHEIRIGCNEANFFRVGNKTEIYSVDSGDPMVFCYDS